ncbi:hypothetical protein INT43_007377 [Umbelopsis isabellina]|uniref:Uncharacterized protein n=1 Tax=Mortierella isabellina TaxID=91625 RepID=A0A8H7PY74_MORIS|nr:hypothetical protein INT43_007377 [Umbelopsis isabellina]
MTFLEIYGLFTASLQSILQVMIIVLIGWVLARDGLITEMAGSSKHEFFHAVPVIHENGSGYHSKDSD